MIINLTLCLEGNFTVTNRTLSDMPNL
jgi:hypothetical protein